MLQPESAAHVEALNADRHELRIESLNTIASENLPGSVSVGRAGYISVRLWPHSSETLVAAIAGVRNGHWRSMVIGLKGRTCGA